MKIHFTNQPSFYIFNQYKERRTKMKVRRIISTLDFLVAFGAIFGGAVAILNPTNPLGLSNDALVNGPFNSFLIPGLFLFLILGCMNLLAGIMTIKQWPSYNYVNILMGLILCMWIIIQCYVLWEIIFLHFLFFIISLIQIWLGIRESKSAK